MRDSKQNFGLDLREAAPAQFFACVTNQRFYKIQQNKSKEVAQTRLISVSPIYFSHVIKHAKIWFPERERKRTLCHLCTRAGECLKWW